MTQSIPLKKPPQIDDLELCLDRAVAKPDFSELPFVMRHRWIFVMFFLFPLSILFNAVMWIMLKMRPSAPAAHEARVKRIQGQIAAWRRSGEKGPLCTDRPGWMAMALRPNSYKNSMRKIGMRDMTNILGIDKSNMTITVEPFVTVAQLTACLYPKGYTLPMVPELDDLTVGGLLMGVGIESSSHKHGLFSDFCVAYEVITANGERIRVTADNEHRELFYALPWSYGTLGFLVSAELRILPCKKYVHLKYFPCYSQQQMVKVFSREACAPKPAEFVEGLVYSRDHAIIMTGEPADDADVKKAKGSINRLSLWFKPWFYEHARALLKTGLKRSAADISACSEPVFSEFIPLRDYYHRHSRSIFWQMAEIVPFGNHVLFRWLLGWLLPIKISLLKLTTPDSLTHIYESRFVFQDMLVPMASLERSLQYFHDEFAMYPLWLCPHQVFRTEPQGMLQPANSALKVGEFEMFVDIGAYGMPPKKPFDARQAVRRVEKFVAAEKGFQMLYADTYMNKDELRAMFNHTLYDRMRTKYEAATAFPDVFTKVRKV